MPGILNLLEGWSPGPFVGGIALARNAESRELILILQIERHAHRVRKRAFEVPLQHVETSQPEARTDDCKRKKDKRQVE